MPCNAFCSFVSLRRLTRAPQRRVFLLGVPAFHVNSMIAHWTRDAQTSIQRWCFVRLAAAVKHAQNRRKYHHLLHEKRCNTLRAAITSAWRSFAVSCRLARRHLQKKFSFDLQQVCGRYFLMWKQVAHTARDLFLKAKTKHRFNMLRAQMHRWRICVISQLNFLSAERRQASASKQRSLLCVLRKWNRCTKKAIAIKVFARRVAGRYQKALLQRSFRCWFLLAKKLHILKLNRQVFLQDKAAARCAVTIARFWTNAFFLYHRPHLV